MKHGDESTDVDTWSRSDFSRLTYNLQQGEGREFDKAKKIELIVRIDGQELIHMQLREPGLMAIISRPDDEGMQLEVVQEGGARLTDQHTPTGDNMSATIADWQAKALGID